ncbi:MAG: hypothetical protein Kow00129_06070 [Thermoleophilia bacterium]
MKWPWSELRASAKDFIFSLSTLMFAPFWVGWDGIGANDDALIRRRGAGTEKE